MIKKVLSNCFVVDNCTSSPCLNQGTCNRYPGGYNCSCQVEFYGDNCKTCKFKQNALVSKALEKFKLQQQYGNGKMV